MINIEATIYWKGYNPNDLKPRSHKKIWAVCDDCGEGRWLPMDGYRDLCMSCSAKRKIFTESHRKNLSKSLTGRFMPSGKDNKNYGLQRTEEQKKRLSITHMGNKPSEETKQKMSKSAMGRIVSEETKQKMSGENNHNYNPNLTNKERSIRREYPEYKEWRKAVYKRDNYMCQFCGMTGIINAHHIESYKNNPELRTKVSNGITMCEDCHHNYHHQYGWGNSTEKQLKKFFGDNK